MSSYQIPTIFAISRFRLCNCRYTTFIFTHRPTAPAQPGGGIKSASPSNTGKGYAVMRLNMWFLFAARGLKDPFILRGIRG